MIAWPYRARMRRWLVLGIVVVLCVSSCRFSKVNSQATVVITGRALDSSGRALVSAQVRLFKEADVGEALLGSVLAVGTLGLDCLLPGAPAPCRSAHVATTDANGGYRFELKGSDTQGLIGEADTLDVVIAAPGSGASAPSTVVRFIADATTVGLPDARLWNAAARLTQTPAQIRLAWSSLPAADGRSVTYSANLYGSAQQETLWSQSAGAGNAAIDARVLEDESGATAAVSAYAVVAGGTGTGTVHASYLSMRLPVRPTAHAPPSRHRACSAVTGTTALATTPQGSCPVTDGNLLAPARLSATGAQLVTGVVVDLGAIRPVLLIVARGVAGQFVVEISGNGTSFQPVGTELGSAVVLAPPGAPTARYVRVRSPSGLDESLMAQISVW
jgi:hypothetical protein